MPDNRINPQPQEGENVERTENTDTDQNAGEERFLSDSQKIVRRHLENEDDVITDEDIRNVRVGMTPPVLDEPTQARFGDEEVKDEVEEEYLGAKDDKEVSTNEDDTITPWDMVDHSK